ncbi:MAG: hypothetical protein IPH76_04405 [Xanthomonadales bacterium]|nr:hypothetical protein [Xanthomonadales bacterium]
MIGHELLHGFDDSGSRFDAQGRLNMWWTPDDRKEFEARADRLVAQAGGIRGAARVSSSTAASRSAKTSATPAA